jgi:hypothetical protein
MRRWLVLLVALCVLASGRVAAAATLDPAAAEKAVQALQRDSYTFCTSPPKELSVRARDLCPLAHEAVGCDALVKACDKPMEPPWTPSPFWGRLAAFLIKIAPLVAWTLVGAVALLVIYLAFRAIRAARDDVALIDVNEHEDVTLLPGDAAPETATAAEQLLRRAAELHARGDERTALFTYLAAALRALDDRGAVRIAKDRTNGEYVRACREASARPPLREIVREVDLVQFGGNDATGDAVVRAAVRAESIVRAPERPDRSAGGIAGTLGMIAIMVLALLAAGCDGHGGSHDDPAGRDLLSDLLAKQGAHVTGLHGSLAALPMKGNAGPVVIIDVERVPLEDETRTHLVAWVKQGGTLVLAGNPHLWPGDFWAKSTLASGTGATDVRVETRGPGKAAIEDDDDDDDDSPTQASAPRIDHAKLASPAAMTWPNEDRAPRAIARLPGGELYAALRVFGEGKILGLASPELLTNLGLVVPGNAAAVIALLGTLDKDEFAIARSEQGISPPSNPFAGLIRIGLGFALAHAAVFIPLLFFAFGARQVAPRPEPVPRRRAFTEHVRAVGALYAKRRAAGHALAMYAKHVDDRVRAKMPRGSDPAQFLAARSGESPTATAELYARAMAARTAGGARGDELVVLEQLSAVYVKALDQV